MTPEEQLKNFEGQFDVLYNNITSNAAPGLNAYEKSVFLTKAQEQLVNEYFNNRTDGAGGGYDGSQRRQYDFSTIIETHSLTESPVLDSFEKLDRRSKVFYLPGDYYLMVNESVSDNKYQYSVLPISYPEYQRLILKPYPYPVKKAAWRLITRQDQGRVVAEIIGRFAGDIKYNIRYVRKLKPIILVNLADYGDDLNINGYSEATPCELPEATYQEILERAVTLAKIAWQGGTVTAVAAQQQQQ